jgi:hypothetical protein
MRKHTKHLDPDLVDALEHIVYEIWKYRQSRAYYVAIWNAGSDAALEFRVLHHRVLLEFFYGPWSHADNIAAWEYVADWRSTHNRASVVWLDQYMKRCHTMLAHISTARSEMSKLGLKAWGGDWETVEPHLDQTITDFLRGLSSHHKKICLDWMQL